MKTLKLLTTTALIAGFLTLATPAFANEQTSWFQNMKQSVQTWFKGAEPKTEVEAYLDEVTVAVPPMTVEDAVRIEPAAGDYQPSLDQALENKDEQSFNATTTEGNVGSVAAFDDYASPEDLAGIMPTAGGDDAEEITDESVVVVEGEAVVEKAADEVAKDVVNEITPSVTTTTVTTATVAPAADVVAPVVAPVTIPEIAPVAVPTVEVPAVIKK